MRQRFNLDENMQYSKATKPEFAVNESKVHPDGVYD
jgi:hypothetical protein